MIADSVTVGGLTVLRARMPANSRCPRILMRVRAHYEGTSTMLAGEMTPREAHTLADALREYAKEAMSNPNAIDHYEPEGGETNMADIIQPVTPIDPATGSIPGEASVLEVVSQTTPTAADEPAHSEAKPVAPVDPAATASEPATPPGEGVPSTEKTTTDDAPPPAPEPNEGT